MIKKFYFLIVILLLVVSSTSSSINTENNNNENDSHIDGVYVFPKFINSNLCNEIIKRAEEEGFRDDFDSIERNTMNDEDNVTSQDIYVLDKGEIMSESIWESDTHQKWKRQVDGQRLRV